MGEGVLKVYFLTTTIRIFVKVKQNMIKMKIRRVHAAVYSSIR